MADDLFQRSICKAEQLVPDWNNLPSAVKTAWLDYCNFRDNSNPSIHSGILISENAPAELPENWFWLDSSWEQLIHDLPTVDLIINSLGKINQAALPIQSQISPYFVMELDLQESVTFFSAFHDISA